MKKNKHNNGLKIDPIHVDLFLKSLKIIHLLMPFSLGTKQICFWLKYGEKDEKSFTITLEL